MGRRSRVRSGAGTGWVIIILVMLLVLVLSYIPSIVVVKISDAALPQCYTIDVGYTFTDYDSCSKGQNKHVYKPILNVWYIPPNGIEGHLHLPTPADACSYISPPPGGFLTDSTWIALVDDYLACPTEMVTNIRNAGYRLIIASSKNDSHRAVTREISDALFPIVVVEENYADYLKENALSFSTENPIVVFVHGNFKASSAGFIIGAFASFFLFLFCPCGYILLLICLESCCKWGIEGHLQKIEKLRRKKEDGTCVINMDSLFHDQPHRSRSLWRKYMPSEDYNSADKPAVLKAFVDLKSHRIYIDQAAVLQQLSKFSNAAAVYSQHIRISLLHYACLNGWNDVVKDLVEKYSCDPNVKMYSNTLAFLSKLHTAISVNYHLKYLYNVCNMQVPQMKVGEEELILSFEVSDGTAIHCACKAGHLDIVKFLIKKGGDPACRNIVGATPLHFACWEGHLDIVRFLVEKGCDPACTACGLTPLHLACRKEHLDIIKVLVKLEEKFYSACVNAAYKRRLTAMHYACQQGYLDNVKLTPLHYACLRGQLDVVKSLVELGIDPNSMDYKGYTPLHIACKYGHLNIVKFLVEEQHCDHLQPAAKKSSMTPLYLANLHGHLGVSSFLTSPGVSRQARYEYLSRLSFPPAFKVFVMGNYSVGKSTLVKAIENKLTNTKWFGSFTDRFKRVSGVELNTAGIIPISIDSKRLGNIIMYDLAGQHEYYSSHAALLEKLVAYPGSLLMVVVDLSKDKNAIIQQLQYWNSFIVSHCSQSGSKPDVVIVGSHADVVKSRQENPKEKSTDILKSVSSSLQVPHDIIPLDCTQLASEGLNGVCAVVGNYCSQFRREVKTDVRLNFLHAFLCQDFEGVTACRVSEIVSMISMKEWDTETVSQYLTTISDKSQFLYLRNYQDVSNSWMILDQGVLLSEVNGTVFAPENFMEHHDISSSTGVVPISKVQETFPKHDQEMIVSFMSHLEFCHPITESEAALIHTGQLGGSEQQFEKLYFFPALVSEDRPEKSCITVEQTHYKCGWSLQCIHSNQFFTVRFLHVLLLRLAFLFALAPEEDRVCPVLQRRCNVWKAGIHWQNRDGVETIVEVVEQNTVVTVMMGCLEGSEVACARLRSEVIRTILNVKGKLIELKEIFIHPDNLSYPLKSLQLLSSFTITELAAAIAEDKQVVTSKQGRYQIMLGISKLLYFEPYTCFNLALLAELFTVENSNKEVPEKFCRDVGKISYSKVHILREILCHNFNELRITFDKVISSPFNDQMDHCYILFRYWARCSPNPTYQALRSALDKFSVFCGRNPLNPLEQCQVPFPPRSSALVSADLSTNDKPLLSMNSHNQDVIENLSTRPHMSDRPHLQELQCLRCQGERRVKVIEGVAARWEHLAHALHFESSVIEIIRRNSFHQTEDACRDVLWRWLEGQGETRQPVNWATLIESLLDAGFVIMADNLREAVEDSNAPELRNLSTKTKPAPTPTRKPHGQGSAAETIIDLSTVPDGSSIKHKPTRESHDREATASDLSTMPHRTDRPRLGELQYLQGRGGRRVKVIEGVAAGWEELAKALYFDSSVIEHVRGTEDACWDILRRWLEGETRQPVNWITLIESLIEAGFIDIATDLQEAVEDYPIDVICKP